MPRPGHAIVWVDMPEELNFHHLAERHRGLTPAVSASYAEAACVCLDRHHLPDVVFSVVYAGVETAVSLPWQTTGSRTRFAWNNDTDATEAGACALALAAIEMLSGLVAVRRAETRTGSDYYIDSPGSSDEDMENAVRLEISGMDAGGVKELRYRLSRKITQAQAGKSNLPAMACVVGFAAMRIEAADVP